MRPPPTRHRRAGRRCRAFVHAGRRDRRAAARPVRDARGRLDRRGAQAGEGARRHARSRSSTSRSGLPASRCATRATSTPSRSRARSRPPRTAPGTGYTSFSGAVRGVRLVTGTGEIRDIAEDEPELLRAAQVSVGMLGVMTRLELEVTDAYRLREQVDLRSWDDVMERWDELVAEHRHFGFFWLPTEESAALYNLDGARRDARRPVLREGLRRGRPRRAGRRHAGRRVDRCYRIFPMVYDPNFHELEYFVAARPGPDALAAMRELMQRACPTPCTRSRSARSARRRVPLAAVPDADDRDLGVGQAGHRLLGLPAVGRRARSPTSTPASTGASCTSSPPSGSTRCTRGRRVHRAPPRARPPGGVPQRPPAPAVRVAADGRTSVSGGDPVDPGGRGDGRTHGARHAGVEGGRDDQVLAEVVADELGERGRRRRPSCPR